MGSKRVWAVSLTPCICLLFALPGDYDAGSRAGGEEWTWNRIFPTGSQLWLGSTPATYPLILEASERSLSEVQAEEGRRSKFGSLRILL